MSARKRPRSDEVAIKWCDLFPASDPTDSLFPNDNKSQIAGDDRVMEIGRERFLDCRSSVISVRDFIVTTSKEDFDLIVSFDTETTNFLSRVLPGSLALGLSPKNDARPQSSKPKSQIATPKSQLFLDVGMQSHFFKLILQTHPEPKPLFHIRVIPIADALQISESERNQIESDRDHLVEDRGKKWFEIKAEAWQARALQLEERVKSLYAQRAKEASELGRTKLALADSRRDMERAISEIDRLTALLSASQERSNHDSAAVLISNGPSSLPSNEIRICNMCQQPFDVVVGKEWAKCCTGTFFVRAHDGRLTPVFLLTCGGTGDALV